MRRACLAHTPKPCCTQVGTKGERQAGSAGDGELATRAHGQTRDGRGTGRGPGVSGQEWAGVGPLLALRQAHMKSSTEYSPYLTLMGVPDTPLTTVKYKPFLQAMPLQAMPMPPCATPIPPPCCTCHDAKSRPSPPQPHRAAPQHPTPPFPNPPHPLPLQPSRPSIRSHPPLTPLPAGVQRGTGPSRPAPSPPPPHTATPPPPPRPPSPRPAPTQPSTSTATRPTGPGPAARPCGGAGGGGGGGGRVGVRAAARRRDRGRAGRRAGPAVGADGRGPGPVAEPRARARQPLPQRWRGPPARAAHELGLTAGIGPGPGPNSAGPGGACCAGRGMDDVWECGPVRMRVRDRGADKGERARWAKG
jgi:hypothetical protein